MIKRIWCFFVGHFYTSIETYYDAGDLIVTEGYCQRCGYHLKIGRNYETR